MAHLYRKAAWPVILLAMMAPLVGAQGQPRQQRGPRAVAVLALPRTAGGEARLVPVFILDNNRFFDAALYRGTPRPIALEPGTVYEAERSGRPAGFFTVEIAVQFNRQWLATGKWQPPRPAGQSTDGSSPVRRREDDEEPPVLRKPAAPTSRTQVDEKAKAIEPPAQEDDPNRPVLKRPGAGPPAKREPAPLPRSAAEAEKQFELVVAVSDASQPDSRPYEFQWTPEEKQRLTQEVAALASAELVRYAKTTPGLRAAPASTFAEVQVRAFDLNYDNEPELVFTAHVPGSVRGAASSGAEFYVTLVARVDLEGKPQKLFASVTDTSHLDSTPRLVLVDAVDAEGDGRGELLFRAIGERARTYELYRVTRDGLWKLFEGGSSAL